MNEHEENQRLPGEVVETYRRPDPREVVEVYTRPLPGVRQAKQQAAPPPVRRKKRKSLWIFVGCLCVAAVLAAAALVLYWIWDDGGDIRHDRFEEYYGEIIDEPVPKEVTIQTWPTGQGVELDVLREHGEPLTAQEVYRRVNPSVVQVTVQVGAKASLGTGVILTEDGYILTNYHVVEGGSDC